MWRGLCDLSVRDALINAVKTQCETSRLSPGCEVYKASMSSVAAPGPLRTEPQCTVARRKPRSGVEDKRHRGQSLKGGRRRKK